MNRPIERQATSQPAEVKLGSPEVVHGADIYRLVRECTPLDLNSAYAYLLLCAHHAKTCVRAEQDGRTVGFVSAYRLPQQPEVLFVWQVAVAAEMRGQGLGSRMLRELLEREPVRGCCYLETTVSPSNHASRSLFQALARRLHAHVQESVMFSERDFGEASHESETLFRIGPIKTRQEESNQ